jgi:tetratricopeptide (TPR) repeat protein
MQKGFLLILIFFTTHLFAQTNSSKQAITEKVFENLVNAYGSNKSSPAIKVLPKRSPKIVAQYIAYPSATVQIDEELFDLCMSFGKDADNALAILLSHELAHYYNDHNWCSDYAFALQNSTLGKTLNKVSKESKIEKESIADSYGLFYASIAGYQPFEIFNPLLDKIYTHYKLTETVTGYPTKKERKEINQIQKDKIEKLIPVFEAGVILTYAGKYEIAISCFNYLNKFFPSRENYNNLGTARLLWALQLKSQQAIEYIYPIEIDPVSRLNSAITRSNVDDTTNLFQTLLQASKKDFERAIAIDPHYAKAYINLACSYDLLENYEAAIGRINDMPINSNKLIAALEIKAIAYAHSNNTQKANECFSTIQKLNGDTNSYNFKVYSLGNQSLLNSENFKEEWLKQNVNDTSLFTKLMNDKKATVMDAKAKHFETKINQQPTTTINSNYSNDVIELNVWSKNIKTRIRKYLLADKTIDTNYSNWKILNKKPFTLLQTINSIKYLITIE